ncbi:hypothetical protein, partial [Streptomyces griseorubens]|uniref:hypothetical protein n=1 Tax=Streptomyces griseorubens TaxID=66897 RepID=UPI003515D0A0
MSARGQRGHPRHDRPAGLRQRQPQQLQPARLLHPYDTPPAQRLGGGRKAAPRHGVRLQRLGDRQHAD